MPSHKSAAIAGHGATATACGKCRPNGSEPSVPAKKPNAVTPSVLLRANSGLSPTK